MKTLVAAGLVLLSMSASAADRIKVTLHSYGTEDEVGAMLEYQLKEELLKSQSLEYVGNPDEATLLLVLQTIDPDGKDVRIAKNMTNYVLIYLYNDPRTDGFTHMTQLLGFAGRQKVEESVKSTIPQIAVQAQRATELRAKAYRAYLKETAEICKQVSEDEKARKKKVD